MLSTDRIATLQRRRNRAQVAFNAADSDAHCFAREYRVAMLRPDYMARWRAQHGHQDAIERRREAQAELAALDAEFAALSARAVA